MLVANVSHIRLYYKKYRVLSLKFATAIKFTSIDEAMIPFKDRLGFKQYMKDKPTIWGSP